MIVSQTQNRFTTSRLWVVAALLVATLLPVGVVNGQDSDAFRKRLEAAVKNGEISSEQAKVLLEVVKKTSKKDTKDTSPSRETMRAIREEIGAAIKAGKIT